MGKTNVDQAVEIVARTHPGAVRTNNEDSVLANTACGIAILADGMGGYNAGEVASGMATILLGTELEKAVVSTADREGKVGGVPYVQAVLAREIGKANGAIFHAANSQPQYSGMGTTLVAAVFHGNKVTVAHLGDSRLYRFRDGQLEQVTRDHSLLQEQIDVGMLTPEQAKLSLNKNLVTRALGVDEDVLPEIHDYEVVAGDIYLLCSDGLSDMVSDSDISDAVGMLSANLELCAEQLIQMANDNGGRDNISVILVGVKKAFPEATPSWFQRLAAVFGIN